jgi:hypothetical protein
MRRRVAQRHGSRDEERWNENDNECNRNERFGPAGHHRTVQSYWCQSRSVGGHTYLWRSVNTGAATRPSMAVLKAGSEEVQDVISCP